jgi:hypothetical protein
MAARKKARKFAPTPEQAPAAPPKVNYAVADNFPDQTTPEDKARQSAEAIKQAVGTIVIRLENDAIRRVGQRNLIEKRWIEDLEQIHGEYDEKTYKKLDAAKKSTLFINQTRPKTNACAARLADMLFPTDDKNWGISPTPVPALTQTAQQVADAGAKAAQEANKALEQGDPARAAEITGGFNQVAQVGVQAKAEMDEAKRRASAMQDEIEDQLRECRYNEAARKVIEDACRIGTGVMKGPIANTERSRRGWTKGNDGVFRLGFNEDPRPGYYRVDPWSFFPESDALTIEESESFFERHLMRPNKFRQLAQQPGFDANAIRRVLKQGPSASMPSYLADLRNIKGENTSPSDKVFQVWEYRGPLEVEEMQHLAQFLGREDLMEAVEEWDPLNVIQVVLWFCQGEVLKIGIHHMDSGEPIYSVYNLEKDDASIWGFGIAYLMRDPQKALNAAWRMMMDNSGLASGPQIEIDTEIVEPHDGVWELAPRKVWKRKPGVDKAAIGIRSIQIDNHQAELANIIMLAKQFIDDVTSISTIAVGEQGSHTTQTAQGMAILMNAVNVIFRRFVKHFDDDLTVPVIRRLYDWNMQFSRKDHIKGDMEVDARGTSVLLVRELQSQNLMVLANFTAHPVIGAIIKAAPILRKLVQSMMIRADDVVKTDDEMKQEAAKAQGQQDPEVMKLQLQKAIADAENDTRLQIARLENETARIQYAAANNIKLEQLNVMLQTKQMEIDHKERALATEIAVEAAQPADDKEGSGGTFSNSGASGGSIP